MVIAPAKQKTAYTALNELKKDALPEQGVVTAPEFMSLFPIGAQLPVPKKTPQKAEHL